MLINKLWVVLNHYNYCVLRNAEEIINGKYNDIDIVIEKNQFDNFVKNLHTEFDLIQIIDKYFLVSYILYDENKENCIWLDIFKKIIYKGLEFHKIPKILENKKYNGKFYTASTEDQFYIAYLNKILYKQPLKESYKIGLLALIDANNKKSKALLWQYFFIKNQKITKFTSNQLRFRLFIKNLFFLTIYFNYIREIIRCFNNKNGICISILGTDGAGKSTIINELQKKFQKTKVFHLRPNLLKNISNIGKPINENLIVTDPHAKKPHNKLKSLISFCYYYFDYIVGYYIKTNLYLTKGNLVIFDRYYYDYYADKKRLRTSLPDWWFKFWEIFIPKPKFVFYLDGDADLFLSRKQEVPKIELEKQINIFRNLCKTHKNFYQLNANKPPNEIAIDILNHITGCQK